MLGIQKAEKLGDFLKVFRPAALIDSDFSLFYYDGTMPIRTGDECASPFDDLFEECTTTLVKNAHLLMGHSGSGKSTELYDLKRKLDKDGYPTIIIDFMAETDFHKASCWDIMLLITEGLCQIADAHSDKVSLPKGTLEAVLNYLKRDETKVDEVGVHREAGVSGGISAATPAILKGLINAIASFRLEVKANSASRTTITEKMEKRASEWITYIAEISDNLVYGLSGKHPVLIFENIDKCRPEKALEILQYPYLSEMPFPIIYTLPISLSYDPRYATLKSNYKAHVLPMIKISNDDKSDNERGIETIREIVKLRANEGLFAQDALTHLIRKTGGVLRDLFECIIQSARRANRRNAQRIEMEDANLALSLLSEELSRQISMPDNKMLVNIYNDPSYREQIEDIQFLLNKTQGLVILEYRNGKRWHNLHPLVADFLIKQGVIKTDNK